MDISFKLIGIFLSIQQVLQSHVYSAISATNSEVGIRYNVLSENARNGKKQIMQGATNYYELVNEGLFVDKSLFIAEILKHFKNQKTKVITFPKRWGKSMNLNMLNRYMKIEVHKNGSRLSLDNAPNHQLFRLGYMKKFSSFHHYEIELNEKLLISAPEYDSINDMYLGKFPIISMELSFSTENSPEHFRPRFKMAIRRAFLQHEYMIDVLSNMENTPGMSANKKNIISDKIHKFRTYLNETNDNIVQSVQFLSELLWMHFKRKVVFLLDEYHSVYNIHDLDYSEYNSFLTTSTKTNRHLHMAVFTGILPILLGINSVLNNAIRHHFIHSPFYKYFGFTTDEIDLLCEYYNLTAEERIEIDYWYDGYHTSDNSVFRVYNPWSVVRYLKTRKGDLYWLVNVDYIQEMQGIFNPEAFRILDILMVSDEGYSYCFTDLLLTRYDLLYLHKYGKGDNGNVTTEIALKYFLYTGYLTLTNLNGLCGKIQIPNEEIRKGVRLINNYQLRQRLSMEEWNNIVEARKAWIDYFNNKGRNSSKLELKLHNHLESYSAFTKNFDNMVIEVAYGNEAVIESYIAITLFNLENYEKIIAEQFLIKPDRSKRGTKPDLFLCGETNLGIVIELKYEDSAENALVQSKKYDPLFSCYMVFKNITEILHIGLNVNKSKEVQIQSEVTPFAFNYTIYESRNPKM